MSAQSPRRPAREKLREVRTRYILDAAQEMLVEKGYQYISMDEIAARVGIAKGTLYQHFPRKENLILALFEQHLVWFEQAIEEAAHANLPARARLEQILRYVYQNQHGAYALLQALTHTVEMRRSLAERKELMFQRMEKALTRIKDILEEGKTEGSFEPTLSTGLMLSAFLNALTLGRLEHLFALEQLSSEELLAQIGHLLFEGFVCERTSER